MSSPDGARQALQTHFGFDDFREGQAEVVEAVLAGENAVVIMPTGGGKSLCYQLPALMLEGVTLVVSPLIALMKDQVDALAARSLPATFINSSLTYAETKKRLSEIRRGVFKIVYIAPERFRSEAFSETMAEARVRLFAIDEAHCISHWGHDFRPDYLRLIRASERLGRPQVIALTATATQKVRDDIVTQLGLVKPRVFVAGFDRPNLSLRIMHPQTEKEKITAIKQLLRQSSGAGIIYTATRKAVEQVTAKLKMADLAVEGYHGGMTDQERTLAQDKFMQGDCQAIVATNAFGMGIDKSDIRFVVHFQVPGSIEAYYQEVGRAGRDGLPADCLLLFNYADTRTHQFFLEGSHPPPELIANVYDELVAVGSEFVELTPKELANRLRVRNEMAVYSSLVSLEKAGHIERGRPSNSAMLAHMKKRIDEALALIPDETNEGGLLRDLIFTRNLNDREQAEFDLADSASALGMSDFEARRALTKLSTMGILDWRVAYQGRGIRLLDAEPTTTLRIDRREIAARAAAEQAKLRKMLDFCYSKKCLRGFILTYFGERKSINNCGSCSVCSPRSAPVSSRPVAGTLTIGGKSRTKSASPSVTTEFVSGTNQTAEAPYHGHHNLIDQAPKGAELRAMLRSLSDQQKPNSDEQNDLPGQKGRALSEAEVVVVKKILSCAARMRGRFGKGAVAAVLKGSKSKQVIESNLHELSTYGILHEMSQEEITDFIKALIKADCLAVGQGAYPTVSLTEFGREVMIGQQTVHLDLSD